MKLKTYMKKHGVTWAKLSELAQVSPGTISKARNGEPISGKAAKRISLATGSLVCPADLVWPQGPPKIRASFEKGGGGDG